jgi:hypothetical protein
MINLKELKQLAKESNKIQKRWPLSCQFEIQSPVSQFIAATNPTRVIQLIESLELATRALKEIYAGDGLIPIDGIAKREQIIAFEALEKLEGII